MSIRSEGASWDDEKGGIAIESEGLPAPAETQLSGAEDTDAALLRMGGRAQAKRPDGKSCPGGYAWFPEFNACRRPSVVGKGALLIEESGNVKIGRWYHQLEKDGSIRRSKKGCGAKVATGEVATTYASLSSCPVSCPLLGMGCYANGGMVMMTTLELNESCVSDKQCALDEAADIRDFAQRGIQQRGGKYRIPPLRLHTAGDCANEENARIVCSSTDEYIAAFYRQPGFSMLADPPGGKSPLPKGVDRYGLLPGASPAWGYTHAWRDIPRAAWGRMSILASCNTTAEVIEAAERGYYVTSLVVPLFSKLFNVPGERHPCNPYENMKVPRGRQVHVGKYTLNQHVCPAQIYDHVSCSNCQLCWREPFWSDKTRKSGGTQLHVILLEVHGVEEDAAAKIAERSGVETSNGLSGWSY